MQVAIDVHVPLEPSRAPVPATVEAQELSSRERAIRAAKVWALCWVVAGASVAIPILHFVLVPAFFLLGPIAAWRTSRARAKITAGAFKCARCGADQAIGEPEVGWPADLTCKACGAGLELRRR